MKNLKKVTFIKSVSILMIMVTVIQLSIINAFAGQGIFLNYSSALKVVTDLDYYKKTTSNQQKQIEEYKNINLGLEQSNSLKDSKINGLQKDYKIQEDRANLLQKDYEKTRTDLIKEKETSPSRMTWFSVGFISAIIIGIASFFVVHR